MKIQEKVSSLVVLLIVLTSLILMLITKKYINLIFLFLISYSFLVYAGLQFLSVVKILPKVLLFSISYLFLFVLFSEGSKDEAIYISCRLFLTAIISISSLSVINAEICIIYLCEKKILLVKWAYPLLFALSSIYLFKKQLELIKINAKLRQLNGWLLPHVLFQFIVFSIRFSERGSMALMTRHLSEEKSFYYDLGISKKDKIIFFMMITAFCCAFIMK